MDRSDQLILLVLESMCVREEFETHQKRTTKKGHDIHVSHGTTGVGYGQIDGYTAAYTPENEYMGHITWANYDNRRSIQHIEVEKKHQRKGVGAELIHAMVQGHAKGGVDPVFYKHINWGMTTPDGTALKKQVDAHYERSRQRARDMMRRSGIGESEDTLTLYHRTSPEAAKKIVSSGRFDKPKDKGMSSHYRNSMWASTHAQGQAGNETEHGYGSAVVSFEVPALHAELDDEFPSGEQHYAVNPRHATNFRHHY